MLKLGFHINGLSQDVFRAIMQVKPGIIKTLDPNVDFFKSVRQALPQTFLIGRLYQDPQEYRGDPEKRGREYAEKIMALEVNRQKIFDAWETFNELYGGPDNPSTDDIARYRDYDRFQVAFADVIRKGGFEPMGMNFSTGTFLGPDWVQHFPGTLGTYKYLGFHEYDWPTMFRVQKESEAKGEEGLWLTLRYRRVMRAVRAAYGAKHVVVITECGMTHAVNGGPDDGFMSGNIPVEEYWKSLKWYNDELNKDDFVLGGCVFVTGATGRWQTFESIGYPTDRMAEIGAAEGAMTLARLAPKPVETSVPAGAASPVPTRMSAQPAPPRKGSLQGRVVNGAGRNLILRAQDNAFSTTAVVAADGSYRFDKLPPGNFILQVEGTDIAYEGIQSDGQTAMSLTLEVGAAPAPQPTAQPTGRVSAKASHNTAQASRALTKSPNTSWSSLEPQAQGMWFTVDLGSLRAISHVRMDSPPSSAPRGCILQVSNDDTNWSPVAEREDNWESLDETFNPVTARFVAVLLTRGALHIPWAINGVTIE